MKKIITCILILGMSFNPSKAKVENIYIAPINSINIASLVSPYLVTETSIKERSVSLFFTPQQLHHHGVLKWNSYRWTWYSEKVLPGYGLWIPGRHVDESGFICDNKDFICVASSVLPKGTLIETPFGKKGKVYDCGCAQDVIDVYVNW